jgi:hypothetical protein
MNRKLVTPLGTAKWSDVVTPRKNRFNDRLEWAMGLAVDEASVAGLLQAIAQVVANAAQRDPAFSQPGLIYPYKPSETKDAAGNKIPEPGKVLIQAKRAAQRMINGQASPNQSPIIYDALGQLAQNVLEVPPGSKCKMIVEVFSYNKAGNAGIGLDLCGVQIGQLAENMPELSPIEGMDAPMPPVGMPAIAPPPVTAAPAWQPAPVAAPPAQPSW